ncbi:MAG: aminoacetone oxidase family FAD-binding enzyme [Lachnospiraceae bacterium]|nr:aminoacetone oxidase family FAD-binding enzyme [Lachnospiraceae bacterium]
MKIAIIGGGASGMMAAIAAARNGAEVTIIERKDRIGKKILATGNGKCNFTNKIINNNDYHSQNNNAYSDYISQFDEKRCILFFQELGMLVKEKNGYCYPRSEQASTILDLLRLELKKYNVTVFTEDYPNSIEKKKKEFQIILNSGKKLYFDRVILSCGSYAGEKKILDPSGYTYAKKFGHKIVPIVPALVQLRVENNDMKSIAGVRCDANISLFVDRKHVVDEKGELQLTDYGISGIPIFQLSRHAAYGIYHKKKVVAYIDFLPEYDMKSWISFAENKYISMPANITVEEFLQGFLNKKLNLYFLKNAGIKPDTKLSNISFSKLEKMLHNMKSCEFIIRSTNPFENAQICAGGISMDEVTHNLESKIINGLYFSGEILDVDGRCGGYNLQWAWSSGYIAGNAASTI